MQSAKSHLPSSKVYTHNRDPKPEYLVTALLHLKNLSHLVRLFKLKNITNNLFPSSTTWHDTLRPLFISVLTYLHKDPVAVPDVLNKDNVLLVRQQVISCFNPLYAQCKVLEQKYRTESINKFIAQRCSNYLDNQKGMINSILNRNQRRIVLDRVLIKDEQTDKYNLLTDPSTIAAQVNHHFQHVAGGS